MTVLGILAACSPQPAVDWSYETSVSADTPAGDYRGVTGTVERLALPSDLVTQREVEVWLPPGYATSTKRYPVLYMHDGQNVFDPAQSGYSGWDWGVDEALTEMGLDVIVVAVHSDSATRFADYFPQKADAAYGARIRKDVGDYDAVPLNADNYLRHLVEELKPHIDATYRTRPEREHTAVMGSSMGGLISLYAISEFPDTFGAAANVSTHFPMGGGALTEFFAERLPDPATHRLYFDYGTKTLDHNYEVYQDRMDVAVRAAGYTDDNWTTRKFEGADHSERAWRNRVHEPLEFLFGHTRFQLPEGRPSPITATGEVIRHAQVTSTEDILPRDIDVWFPPSYQSSEARYPVVYVHDGNVIFDPALSTISGEEWGVDEAMTELIKDGAVREAIIVGLHSTAERYEDFMPEKAIRPMTADMRRRLAQRPREFNVERMHSDAYLRFLTQELKPAIDATYRTLSGRDDTMVMGASTSGLIAAYALMEYPDTFGASAGLSTHVGSAEGAFVDYLEANPPAPSARIYFDYGDQGIDADWDYPAYHARIDAALKRAGFQPGPDYTNRLYPGTGHGEAFWRARINAPLLFLLGTDR